MPHEDAGSYLAVSLAAVSGADLTVAFVFFVIAFIVYAVYSGIVHEKKDIAAWTWVAAQYDLHPNGRFDLAGRVGDFDVKAHTYKTGFRKSRTTWTRVTVEGGLTRAVAIAAEGSLSRAFGQDIVLGDGAFDQAVKVTGDEAVALALLDRNTRRAIQRAVTRGWSFEDGTWTFKVSERLGEGLGERIEVGLSLAELTRKGQSELPQRLLALVTHDDVPSIRRRALAYLVAHFPDTPSAQAALESGLRDSEPAVRLMAADRLRELGVLDALAGSAPVEPLQRVEALEAMVRHGPDDARTQARVSEWLDLDLPQIFRKTALEAVARVAVPNAEARLIEALSAPADDLKLAAIRSLAVVGTVRAVPALIPFRDALLAFTLKGAAKDAILAIQARVAHGEVGALALAGEGGGLAMIAQHSEQDP